MDNPTNDTQPVKIQYVPLLQRFIRQNTEGENVLQYTLLDTNDRLALMYIVKEWAGEIEVQFTDLEFSDSDRLEAIRQTVESVASNVLYNLEGQPTIHDWTEQTIKDHLVAHLAIKYGIRYNPR